MSLFDTLYYLLPKHNQYILAIDHTYISQCNFPEEFKQAIDVTTEIICEL